MEDFSEIAQTSGTVLFEIDQEGHLSIGFKSKPSKYPAAIFQLCISYDGKLIDTVPAGGMGQTIIYPQPTILAFLVSDIQGMFGRFCRKCNSYFRTDTAGKKIYCPYCGIDDHNLEFTTDNQLEFLSAYCNQFIQARRTNKSFEIDLDVIAQNLKNNKSKWIYSEEKQQTTHQCVTCKTKFDILGEYGICPNCQKHTAASIINKKLDEFAQQFNQVDETISNREDREVEWEKLARCISEFEAMANDLRKHLLKLPAIPKRKSDLSNLSFQNILKSNNALKNWYGFEILNNITQEDKNFLNIMFNRRHIFIHNGGRVDQEYINNTGDNSVRINQVIKFRCKEIKRLMPLVKQVSNNLINGFEQIK